MAFDKETATPEELWKFYMGKYQNPNPAAKWLTEGFFSALGRLLKDLPQDSRILELGCGPGISTRRILELIQDQYLEASEFEQRLVDLLLKNGFPVTLSQESAYEMHRADDEFDCILLLEVLEHLENVDLALSEIFRVARQTVIISVPNEPLWRILNFMRGKYWREWGNTPGHINHWSKKPLVKLLAQHGNIKAVLSPTPWTIVQVDMHD